MKTVLKSFRLKEDYERFLDQKSKDLGVSQAAIIELALEQMKQASLEWEEDLRQLAEDKAYKEEQKNLANEFYEDFER